MSAAMRLTRGSVLSLALLLLLVVAWMSLDQLQLARMCRREDASAGTPPRPAPETSVTAAAGDGKCSDAVYHTWPVGTCHAHTCLAAPTPVGPTSFCFYLLLSPPPAAPTLHPCHMPLGCSHTPPACT